MAESPAPAAHTPSAIRGRLDEAHRKGRLFQTHVMLPLGLLSLSLLSAVFAVALYFSFAPDAMPQAFTYALLGLGPALMCYLLAIPPAVDRIIRLAAWLLAAMDLTFALVLVSELVVGAPALRSPCVHARLGPLHCAAAVVSYAGLCGTLLVALGVPLVIVASLRRRLPSRRMLDHLWSAEGVGLCVASACLGMSGVAELAAQRGPWRPALLPSLLLLLFGGQGSACGALLALPRARRRMQSWLAARSEAASAAASIAALMGGLSTDAIQALLLSRLRALPLDALTPADIASAQPDPDLYRRSVPATMGAIDAFISHSWSDDSAGKWAGLQTWRRAFVARYGREPRVWLDKACIDQGDIAVHLQLLPVFLASCNELVAIGGRSYLSRLWCVTELFVFLEMGGCKQDVTFIVIEPPEPPPVARNALGDSRVRSKLWLAKARLKSLEARAALSPRGSSGQLVGSKRASRASCEPAPSQSRAAASKRSLARRFSLLIGVATEDDEDDEAAVAAGALEQSSHPSCSRASARTVPLRVGAKKTKAAAVAAPHAEPAPSMGQHAIVEATAATAPTSSPHAAPKAPAPGSPTEPGPSMWRAALAVLGPTKPWPTDGDAPADVDLEGASPPLAPRPKPTASPRPALSLWPSPSQLVAAARAATPPPSLIEQWREAISKFDVRLATAYVAEDKAMLLSTIEAGFSSHERFNAAVIGVLSSVIETSIVAGANPPPRSAIGEASARARVGAGVRDALRCSSRYVGGTRAGLSRQQTSSSTRSDLAEPGDGSRRLANPAWARASARSAAILPLVLRTHTWRRGAAPDDATPVAAAESAEFESERVSHLRLTTVSSAHMEEDDAEAPGSPRMSATTTAAAAGRQ